MREDESLHPCEIDHREGRKDAEFSINIFSININDSFLGIPRRSSELASEEEAVVALMYGEGPSHCGFQLAIFVDDRACAGLSAK
jgi:hypothetical protein